MKLRSLNENYLFQKAYRNGTKAVSESLCVFAMRDYFGKSANFQSDNRIGISASKKIGGAVQRNRAKRLVREAYTQIAKENDLKSGQIIVVTLRVSATVCKMQKIKNDLYHCLKKTGIIL